MLLSMRYVLSLTAARFLCGAGGALSGGGGGSSLALEEAGIAELLEGGAPLPNARASVCSMPLTKRSLGWRKPRVRPVGPSVWYHVVLLSSCGW